MLSLAPLQEKIFYTEALWEAEAMRKVGDPSSTLFIQISQILKSQNSFHLPNKLFAGNGRALPPPHIIPLK